MTKRIITITYPCGCIYEFIKGVEQGDTSYHFAICPEHEKNNMVITEEED